MDGVDRGRQRQRSLAIAWVLVALVALFFVVTVVRLGGNVTKRMQSESGGMTTTQPVESKDATDDPY